ncbi:MAG: hypothetical protein AAGG53_15780 [Cyanobacteria bacterium P01_H01_bin.152]
MTTTTTAPANTRTAHQRRLRATTKRLVIELGYLEHCLTEGLQDPHLRTAATSLDTAIASLQQHLSER